MFNLYASVHNHINPRSRQQVRRFPVFYIKLHPENFWFNPDGFVCVGNDLCRISEYVDNIHGLFNIILGDG